MSISLDYLNKNRTLLQIQKSIQKKKNKKLQIQLRANNKTAQPQKPTHRTADTTINDFKRMQTPPSQSHSSLYAHPHANNLVLSKLNNSILLNGSKQQDLSYTPRLRSNLTKKNVQNSFQAIQMYLNQKNESKLQRQADKTGRDPNIMKGSITQNKDDLRDPQEKIHTQSKADTEMVNTIKINRIVSKQRCDREQRENTWNKHVRNVGCQQLQINDIDYQKMMIAEIMRRKKSAATNTHQLESLQESQGHANQLKSSNKSQFINRPIFGTQTNPCLKLTQRQSENSIQYSFCQAFINKNSTQDTNTCPNKQTFQAQPPKYPKQMEKLQMKQWEQSSESKCLNQVTNADKTEYIQQRVRQAQKQRQIQKENLKQIQTQLMQLRKQADANTRQIRKIDESNVQIKQRLTNFQNKIRQFGFQNANNISGGPNIEANIQSSYIQNMDDICESVVFKSNKRRTQKCDKNFVPLIKIQDNRELGRQESKENRSKKDKQGKKNTQDNQEQLDKQKLDNVSELATNLIGRKDDGKAVEDRNDDNSLEKSQLQKQLENSLRFRSYLREQIKYWENQNKKLQAKIQQKNAIISQYNKKQIDSNILKKQIQHKSSQIINLKYLLEVKVKEQRKLKERNRKLEEILQVFKKKIRQCNQSIRAKEKHIELIYEQLQKQKRHSMFKDQTIKSLQQKFDLIKLQISHTNTILQLYGSRGPEGIKQAQTDPNLLLEEIEIRDTNRTSNTKYPKDNHPILQNRTQHIIKKLEGMGEVTREKKKSGMSTHRRSEPIEKEPNHNSVQLQQFLMQQHSSTYDVNQVADDLFDYEYKCYQQPQYMFKPDEEVEHMFQEYDKMHRLQQIKCQSINVGDCKVDNIINIQKQKDEQIQENCEIAQFTKDDHLNIVNQVGHGITDGEFDKQSQRYAKKASQKNKKIQALEQNWGKQPFRQDPLVAKELKHEIMTQMKVGPLQNKSVSNILSGKSSNSDMLSMNKNNSMHSQNISYDSFGESMMSDQLHKQSHTQSLQIQHSKCSN